MHVPPLKTGDQGRSDRILASTPMQTRYKKKYRPSSPFSTWYAARRGPVSSPRPGGRRGSSRPSRVVADRRPRVYHTPKSRSEGARRSRRSVCPRAPRRGVGWNCAPCSGASGDGTPRFDGKMFEGARFGISDVELAGRDDWAIPSLEDIPPLNSMRGSVHVQTARDRDTASADPGVDLQSAVPAVESRQACRNRAGSGS
jgi:hypothetical protein